MPAEVAWSLLSPLFLFLVWGLGNQQRTSLAIFIATISGAILPVLGLLVSYRGLTLSIAGLLSVTWLAVRLWYGWEPSLRKL
jgi:fucose permease